MVDCLHSTGGGGYTGPGDVVSGAYAWYSCSRGYNAADTANACNVCLPADTTCADLTLSAGFVVLPGSLSTCNITTVICTVKTAYDKSGNGRNVTQATEANRPTFRPAMASNGCPTTALPCMLFTAASSQRLITAGGFTISQPVTFSIVSNKASASNGQEQFGFAAEMFLFTNNAVNRLTIWTGAASTPNVTVSDTAWHALQAVVNRTSSNIYVDGSANASSAAATGATNRQIFIAGPPSVSNYWGGYVAEAGIGWLRSTARKPAT